MKIFVGFYAVNNIKSETIVAAIKDALLRFQLHIFKCRGQTYNGVSNMMGKKSGVAAKIIEMKPKVLATHCHSHSLNLSVKTTTEQAIDRYGRGNMYFSKVFSKKRTFDGRNST